MKKIAPKPMPGSENLFVARVVEDMVAPILARAGQLLAWGPLFDTTLHTLTRDGRAIVRSGMADARTPLLLALLTRSGIIEPMGNKDALLLRARVGEWQ